MYTNIIPIILAEYFVKLNFITFKKSLNNSGDEIPKKKKCHVHNGQADRRLLLIKNNNVVVKDNFVKILSFLENRKKIPKQLKQNRAEINFIP